MKLFLLLLIINACSMSQTTKHKSDVGKTPVGMIQNHKYPVETHHVVTEDKYIISLYRIPHSRSSTRKEPNAKTVLIGHGLGSSSGDFVSMGPNRSLAFILAEEGYDVWLLNTRGTTFSRSHLTLNSNDLYDKEQYFDFSFHEIGYYDLPASIDYILKLKNDKQLHYVGHSQGGTSFYVMAATRPEYNSKIKLAALLAAPGIMVNYGLYMPLARNSDSLAVLFKFFAIYELPFAKIIQPIFVKLCPRKMFRPLCVLLYLGLSTGENLEQWDWKYIDVIGSNSPCNIATKQVIHYLQCIKFAGFNYYDYGKKKNLGLYRQEEPPGYNLSNVVAPIALYYGVNDRYAVFEDLEEMAQILPNVVQFYKVPNNKFNHVDFLFARDVVKLVYDRILDVMNKY